MKRSLQSFLSIVAVSWVLTSLSVAVAQVSKLTSETDLIAILQSDKSQPEDKAMACKRLAVYGSDQCVSEVSKLLDQDQLSSWARITLEAIPGRAANDALRNAAKALKGRTLIGVLNSIGVRRDVGSVELLSTKLQEKELGVAAAAAVALGSVGNPSASDALKKALVSVGDDVRTSVAEGLVLCAERAMNEGKLPTAIEMYDLVRSAKVPQQRILEATRGAILARKADGVPILIGELRATEYPRFQLGLTVARELEGIAVDKALAAELGTASPDRAALIIQAMADRPKTVDLTAITKAIAAEAKPVRLSAIKALGSVGTVNSIAALLSAAKGTDQEQTDACVVSLSQISDAGVDIDLAKKMETSQGTELVVLIRALGQRGVPASDRMIGGLVSTDQAVRNATFSALADTLPANKLAVLISQFLSPKYAEDQEIASKSLMTAASRMPDREECAAELATALTKATSNDLKGKVIEILGLVGGTKALNTVADAALSKEDILKDASTKALGNWMTIDAAAMLQSLAEKMPEDRYRSRAVKAYLRIARQFDMTLPERVAMAESAIKMARQPDERKLILDVLKRNPSLEMLQIAARLSETEDLKADAIAAANEIAGKIKNQTEKVQAILSTLPK
jgi:HEAT repeat protein